MSLAFRFLVLSTPLALGVLACSSSRTVVDDRGSGSASGAAPRAPAPSERASVASAATFGPRSSAKVPPPLRAAIIGTLQREASRDHDLEPSASGFRARIPGQALRVDFGARGALVSPDRDAAPWSFQPAAARWGCDGDLAEVAPAAPEASGNRATYHRGGFDEWYVNGPAGIEHGFTLPAAPACRARGGRGVVIELAGGADLRATIADGGRTAILRDGSGATALRYSDLRVVDARGRELPAELRAGPHRLSIDVDDRGASYPITVDPLVWVEQAVLQPDDLATADQLGVAVALSGETAIVGTYYPNNMQGAAYVYVRTGDAWSLHQKLLPDGADGGGFGGAIALEGDVALVSAQTLGLTGAVYAFQRTGSAWSKVDLLTASYGKDGDRFGSALAMSGTTAIICAYATGTGTGTAYVFERSGTQWAQTQTLEGSATKKGDELCSAAAIEGDTALVSAVWGNGMAGEVYVFTRSNGHWSEQQRIAPSGLPVHAAFGGSLALSGDTALIGAEGEYFGTVEGSAYVYRRSGATWALEQKLLPSDPQTKNAFGATVALQGDTALVGAYGVDSSQGAVYAFGRTGSSWSESQKITASDGQPWELFGTRLALDGDTAVITAYAKGPDAKGGLYAVVLPKAASGEPCLAGNECQSGACRGGACCEADCAGDACHTASCAPGTGACTISPLPDGSPCDDGDACTEVSTCVAGVCQAGASVSCAPADECHEPGACDPATGGCSSPTKPDGVPCTLGTCRLGVCTEEPDPPRDAGAEPAGDREPASTVFGGCATSPGSTPGAGALAMAIALLASTRRRGRRSRRPLL